MSELITEVDDRGFHLIDFNQNTSLWENYEEDETRVEYIVVDVGRIGRIDYYQLPALIEWARQVYELRVTKGQRTVLGDSNKD